MTRLHQSRQPNRYRKRGIFFEVYMGVKVFWKTVRFTDRYFPLVSSTDKSSLLTSFFTRRDMMCHMNRISGNYVQIFEKISGKASVMSRIWKNKFFNGKYSWNWPENSFRKTPCSLPELVKSGQCLEKNSGISVVSPPDFWK